MSLFHDQTISVLSKDGNRGWEAVEGITRAGLFKNSRRLENEKATKNYLKASEELAK